MDFDWAEISLRLGAATGAGMIVGIEREMRQKIAGLRTHMLVSLGTAAVLIVALQLEAELASVIQGILTGIGFIGAGAIFHSSRDVEGVTTAASIWTTTVIGLAAGAGLFKIVVLMMILALFILVLVWMLERAFATKS
jgi:putative Mg2+ transporter-C (MgtC) family protein